MPHETFYPGGEQPQPTMSFAQIPQQGQAPHGTVPQNPHGTPAPGYGYPLASTPEQHAGYQPSPYQPSPWDSVPPTLVRPGSAPASSYRPGTATPSYTAPRYTAPRKSSSKGLVVFLMVVALAAAGAWGWLSYGDVVRDYFAPDFNTNYSGAPISAADQAEPGKELIVSSSGKVSLEVDASWQEVSDLLDAFGDPPSEWDAGESIGVWADGDLNGVDANAVMAQTLEAPSALSKDELIEAFSYVVGKSSQGFTYEPIAELRWGAPVYTAQGLQGFASDYRASSPAISYEISYYIFARGKTVVALCFIGTDVTTEQELVNSVVDSLRIDK